MKALVNAVIFTGERMIKDRVLLIDNGIILEIIDLGSIPSEAEILDCQGAIISAGLIDLQIYGGGGSLFSADPSPEALQKMTDSLIRSGTTNFLLTLATNTPEVFDSAIDMVQQNPNPSLLGLHFEGPYLNPAKKGAHIEACIRRPDTEKVSELLARANGVLKMVTVAPEVCTPEVLALFTDNGVVLSAGHSNATFEEASRGFENGISTATHLFNAMSSMHHRDTGLPGAVFLSKNAFSSIIADGIHVDFAAIAIAKKVMGDRLFLITDAVEEASQGPYLHVRQKDRFTLPDGTLSGSNITLLQSIQNCVEKVGISLEESIRMATLYPAKVIGRSDLGSVAPGKKANLTVFKSDFSLLMTIVEGTVYHSQNVNC